MGKKLNYPNFRRAMRAHGRRDTYGEPSPIFLQQARCANGQHDEAVAEKGFVTYLGSVRLKEGTKYCRLCNEILC